MTREEFLANHWRKYPVFAASAPPTEEAWLAGRVQSLKQDEGMFIELSGQNVPVSEEERAEVSALGLAAPFSALVCGDVVAYNIDTQAVFLLSPCLAKDRRASEGLSLQWQMFLHAVHDYFVQQGFIHWLTPTFVESSGVDANIDFFVAQGVRTGREFQLPTSPEFELKKALVAGVERVYEVKKCFRDDDATPIHLPEFTMLEWYRAFANLKDIELDVAGLVQHLIGSFALPIEFEGFQAWTVSQLFAKYLDFVLTPNTTVEDLRHALQQKEWDFLPTDTWNDLFFRLYIDGVEPYLKDLGFIIVSGFPAQQSSLARLTIEGWADRFECYWNGVEIANAYHEENNPENMRKTILRERAIRLQQGKKSMALGEGFLRDMQAGLPPSAGIALGLDRLFMGLWGHDNI